MATAQPKHPSPWVFACWYMCAFVCVCSHACLHISVFVFHWGLFLRVRLCQISSQIWASGVDTKCACFVFVKPSFVAKCTCKNFALKWLSCRGRAVARLSGAGKSWERGLKFVEIVWGFTMKSCLIYQPLWQVTKKKIKISAILTMKLFVVPSPVPVQCLHPSHQW